MKKRILLSGIGGFGETYTRLLCGLHDRGEIDWVGAVDPFAKSAGGYQDIRARGIAVFNDMEHFHTQKRADLTIVCSPIAEHCRQSVAAMRHGSDVLLEKPVAATLDEARQVLRVRDETAQKVSVAFQWCYDPVMLRLKEMSDAGHFGRLRRMRSLVLWPRPRQYYLRNAWAGRNYDAAGKPVFDSISANATAHYLFNMLWLAGTGYEGALPQQVEATLWRANEIETFDTATILMVLPGEIEALHVASHAAGRDYHQNPMFLYEYEHASVSFGAYGKTDRDILIRYVDGTSESLGGSNPDTEEKLKKTLREMGSPTPTVCPVEAAVKHVAVLETLRARGTPIRSFDDVQTDMDMAWVPGLAGRLIACYEGFRLL